MDPRIGRGSVSALPLQLCKGDFDAIIELSSIVVSHSVWLSCEVDRDGTRATCRDLPEGKEMKACGRVSHPPSVISRISDEILILYDPCPDFSAKRSVTVAKVHDDLRSSPASHQLTYLPLVT